jgi:hypothetical protein
MNRSIILALSLACVLNTPSARADFQGDAIKLAASAGIGYGIGYGISSLTRASANDKIGFATLATLAGLVIAIPSTSYVRYMRAQWSFTSTNAELMAILQNTHNDSTLLMNALESYYLASQYSLLQAYSDLLKDDAHLAHAEGLFKCIENSFLHNAQCTTYMKNTLKEIAQLRSLIKSALIAIKQDPRWTAMLAARNAAQAAQQAASIAQQQLYIAQQQLAIAQRNQQIQKNLCKA